MIPILEYITQVHNRSQNIDYIKRTPHMDLVEDFMFDMKSHCCPVKVPDDYYKV